MSSSLHDVVNQYHHQSERDACLEGYKFAKQENAAQSPAETQMREALIEIGRYKEKDSDGNWQFTDEAKIARASLHDKAAHKGERE